MTRDRDELLSAWADDPRSLTPAERAEIAARVERDPALRREAEETRALLGRLRELPDEGVEPAWDRFQRQLERALDESRPRGLSAWLARWWKPALGLGLAVAAAVIVIVARRAPSEEPPVAERERDRDAGALPLYIVDVPSPPVSDDDAPYALGAVGEIADEDLDEDVLDEVAAALEIEPTDEDVEPEDGLVPDLALDWIDELDDDEIDRVDAWLAMETE